MNKINLPDGGQYRVESQEENKVRIYYSDKKVNRFILRQVTVKIPEDKDLSGLTEKETTDLVNTMINHDQVVGCPFCDETTPLKDMKNYGFAGSICKTCWNHCVCRECEPDDWNHEKRRSPRRNNEKTCPHCGQRLVTKVATG